MTRPLEGRPRALLLAGPAGAGKTTTAARLVAREPGWVHLPEDDRWVEVKRGRPAGEMRTAAEQDVVHAGVVADVTALVRRGRSVVVDLVLYEDPPRPLLVYRRALTAAGIGVVVRLLRPGVEETLRRLHARGRPGDLARAPGLRADAARQDAVLDSPAIQPGWVVRTAGLTPDDVVDRVVASLG